MTIYSDHMCDDLPSKPRSDLGTILVTGASGYIGGLLVPELIARGYKVRIMIRKNKQQFIAKWPTVEIVIADACDMNQLLGALKGVDIAYYLIHSLIVGTNKFEEIDLKIASNFKKAAEKNKLKRIIYLSGLGCEDVRLSPHLLSRMQVGKRLCHGNVPVTVLRAGMIIGSGSASYAILENLVKRMRFFFIPYWAKTKGQPIAIRDVIKYLVGVMEIGANADVIYDIGGETIIAYDEMLKVFARVSGKNRFFFPALMTSTYIYGFFVSLLVPIPKAITKALIEGCKNEVICENNDIKEILPFKPLTFEEALHKAMKINQ